MVADTQQTQPGAARREPIFEGQENLEDQIRARNTLDDDYSGNRGMDDSAKTARSREKRTESYVRSKVSNINQTINQGNL